MDGKGAVLAFEGIGLPRICVEATINDILVNTFCTELAGRRAYRQPLCCSDSL